MNRNTIIVIACYVIAIWCFFLQWARIGFLDMSPVSITGFDMVKGLFGAQEAILSNNPGSEILAFLASIAAIAGLITCFFKYKAALIVRIVSGIAGAALLFVLSITIPEYIHSLSELQLPTSFLPGYWLAIITLAITGIMSIVKILADYLRTR